MRPGRTWLIGLAAGMALLLAGGSAAQLLPQLPVPSVPGPGEVIRDIDRTGRKALDRADDRVGDIRAEAGRLAARRTRALRDLVRRHPGRLEMTDLGPAVRGEVTAVDPDPAGLAAAEAAGFSRLSDENVEGLDIRIVTLRVPRGWSVDRALARLRRIAPDAAFAANHLHLQSGMSADAGSGTAAAVQGRAAGARVGMIDGGVADHPALRGSVQQRGFVRGAPAPSAHGTAVASLIAGQGSIRGAAPGTPLLVADIFGRDPAGGNAVALVRALGWLAQQETSVVAISLVGPVNPLVARAVALARGRGMFLVAAVGNDGPAAPPAYPASYPGVIAVTGVDGRGRVLIEAGRALHLDYAAPGADMAAAGTNGRSVAVRGTSYAVPFVAGRLASHVGGARPLARLDAEAVRGGRGVGRGIVCGDCRTPHRRN